MSTLNIIGIVVLVSVVLLGTGIKLCTRKKLSEMDGMGVVHTIEPEKENGIYL
jgi:hypothetical protein